LFNSKLNGRKLGFNNPLRPYYKSKLELKKQAKFLGLFHHSPWFFLLFFTSSLVKRLSFGARVWERSRVRISSRPVANGSPVLQHLESSYVSLHYVAELGTANSMRFGVIRRV